MFLLDTVFLTSSVITGILTTLLVAYKARQSPLKEANILWVSYLLFTIGFLLYLPLTIWNTPQSSSVNSFTVLLFKIGSIFATIGIECTLLAIFLPTFSLTYRKILALLGFNMVYITSSVLNFNISIIISNKRLLIVYPFWTALFIIAGQIILIYMMIYRIHSVSKITESPFFTTKSLLVAVILASITGLAIALPSLLPNSPVPTFTNALITAFLFLYFSVAFYQDDAFIFVTDAKLEAVLIADSNTGLSLHSTNFNLDLPPEQLLTSIFTSINLSMKEILKSDSQIDNIRFGDKVILIAKGKSLSTFMITTARNFISQTILNYIKDDLVMSYHDTESRERLNSPMFVREIDYKNKIMWLKRYMPH